MKKSLVYTKTGDNGTTALVGGQRVQKNNVRLNAYGTIDELNSFIGFLICEIEEQNDIDLLTFIQNKLFTVGAYLATDTEHTELKPASIVKENDITRLEHEIDRIDESLPPLRQFILPRGNECSTRAHICRSVCRRAERRMYNVHELYAIDATVLKFVNRLSDYFFLLARKEAIKNNEEIFWNQGDI